MKTLIAAAALLSAVAFTTPASAGFIQIEDIYVAPSTNPGAGPGTRLSNTRPEHSYSHTFLLPADYTILSASIEFRGWDNNGGNENYSVFYDLDAVAGFTIVNFANGGASIVSTFLDEFTGAEFAMLQDGALQVTISRNSGGFTFIGSTFNLTAVPEPMSALLLGVGLLGLQLARRRAKSPSQV